jgi:hypothetical protein
MADLFSKNTFVRGHGWFGPDYPGNEVTSEVEAAVTAARGGGGAAATGADKGEVYGGGTSADISEADQARLRAQREAGADAGQDVTGGAGSAAGDTTTAPPRSGAGATRSAWADYAQAKGVDIEDGASRDDIIAAVDAAAE